MTIPSSFPQAKHPSESRPITVEWYGQLPDGDTISSGSVTAVDTADDADASSDVLDSPATVTVDGTQTSFVVTGGTSGKTYKYTLTITTSSGHTLVETLTMEVST